MIQLADGIAHKRAKPKFLPQELVVHEREGLRIPFGKYCDALPFTKADIARKLHVNYAQMGAWITTGIVPRAVWRYAVRHWSDKGFKVPAPIKNGRAFRLPRVPYAEVLGLAPITAEKPSIELMKATVPEPPPPESVPWAVFEAAMRLLLHQNAALVTEVAVVNTRNIDLEKQNGILAAMANGSVTFGTTLDAVANIPKVPAPASETEGQARKAALAALDRMSAGNGNKPALRDLEKRLLPFVPRPVT